MNRPEFTHEDIVNIVKKAGDKAREGRNETKSEKTIHDDFRKKVLHFRQNRSWDLEGSPEIKTVFSFDDPSLLDDCPFVCKISIDQKGEYKYFGVAYELEENAEKLKKWAEKFNNAKLLTYRGDFIEKV